MLKIIGLGNKARQGKDISASYFRKKIDNSATIHFADPLKDELSRKTALPKIIRKYFNDQSYFFMLDSDDTYKVYKSSEMLLLEKVFNERGINEYFKMNEKDPLMLQVWGTDFRRRQNNNYWVNRVEEQAKKFEAEYLGNRDGFIFIPDVRFINEYEWIKKSGGHYIRVMRLNEDGTQYIDPERDPTHKSEVELDNAKADFTIIAKTGDMKEIEKSVDSIIKKIL